MWQCRKIYANLLLLSVLMFALGASSAPRINWNRTGGTVWNDPESSGGFHWECCSGKIIYRGQQITAVAGSELEFVVPEAVRDILNIAVFTQNLPGNGSSACAEIVRLPQERGPPENAVFCELKA